MMISKPETINDVIFATREKYECIFYSEFKAGMVLKVSISKTTYK